MAGRGLRPDATEERLACPLCGAVAELRCEDHPGYQENTTFDIGACASCNTSFVLGRDVDPAPLYDQIYSQVEAIPGYERYQRYAQGVLRASDPLRYLADAEDSYWAIENYLFAKDDPRDLKIIEIGSGLGYLTYALAKRGLSVRGIDLSESAVAQARRIYGNCFECADVQAIWGPSMPRFDVILMTEVLEHVPDPVGFLSALGRILAPDGEIVVATPNKSYHRPDAVWETDLPPIHMWWFSEASLRLLARRLDCQIRFVDFGPYNRSHYCQPAGMPSDPALRAPILDADGRVRSGRAVSKTERRLKSIARDLGVTGAVRSLQARLVASVSGVNRPRPTLCAIFSKVTTGAIRSPST